MILLDLNDKDDYSKYAHYRGGRKWVWANRRGDMVWDIFTANYEDMMNDVKHGKFIIIGFKGYNEKCK